MPRKSRKNVGLIGLGIIGSRVAAGLRSAGFHVFVWNRNPRPVPNFLGSPLEVAEMCEVIQLFVADGPAVFQTIEAFGDVLTPKHVVINCATIGPEATKQAAQMVEQRGALFLDAPFTGSKGAAEKSQLVYYVGGEQAVFERVKPVLEATSRAIVHCGKVGDAATLKVATNMITAVTTQTLAEALAIVRKSGIAPEAFGAALHQNACKSGVVDLKLPKMLTGDFSPHFSVKHMFKDVQLGIELANALHLDVPATAATAGVLFGGMNKGWGDLDFASVYKQYMEEAGAEEPVKSLGPRSAPQEVTPEIEELERIESPVTANAKPASEAQVAPAAASPEAKPSPAPAKDEEKPLVTPQPEKSAPASQPAPGEPTKLAASIIGATVIEAEVVPPDSDKSDAPTPEQSAKLEDKDSSSGALSRLRRLFSSPGK